ncbi:redoxin domain-containing protein [Persicitalea sp.]|uniref:redoxin domain-containing protein n=1 Tax=Persicitalea sp. TaxID=3100273 RepID=UPI00359488FD
MKKGLTIRLWIGVLAAFLGQEAVAQGYQIEATLKGLKDTTAILGHYKYNGQQFIAKDTARSDASGRMVFEGEENLPGGLYLILLPGQQKLVQLVYSGKETNFSLQTDTSSIVESMVVKGSRENQLFYEYQQELGNIMEGVAALNMEKKLKTDQVSTALVNKKINDQQQKFTDYQKKLLADHADTFTAKLFRVTQDPEIPDAPVLANGRKDSVWVFNYYKNHFWDNFDFADERLLRTPFLQPKLERYVKELIVQVPDSVNKDADALIQKAAKAGNKELKSQIIYYITSEYENPKVVGTEGVFVHMAEKYYLSGEMEVSADAVKRIGDRVTSMKPLLVNQVIPDLTLSDTDKKPISIHGIKADYTVLFFYSPTCGHCKDAAPALKEFYDKNKVKGAKVMAIATDQSSEDWKKFVKDYKLEELTNGYDYTFKHDFRTEYDVQTTPTIYVLDKNKKVIARKMPIEQLDDFFNFYLRNQAAKSTAAN